MPDDPLDIIAASYKTLADTQQTLAQTQLHMEETQRLALRLQDFALRLLASAIVLIGLSLLFTGYLAWQHVAMRHESAMLQQAVLTNTQTIAAQTQALLERLRQP